MIIDLNKAKLLVLSFIVIISVTACFETAPDIPPISPGDTKVSGKGFVYPKAPKEWDKYIGLFQKDAVSIAGRKEYWPDDNSISYLRSYAGIYSGDEHLGYVWEWLSKGHHIVFISGMIDNSGITNIVINNKNELTIDEILMSFTADEDSVLLGEYEVDYFTHLWTDYTTESKSNLDSSAEYPLVKENEVIDLLTYSDNVNCQEVYWVNGERKGANTDYFKQLISNLKDSVVVNNIDLFEKQLPEILNMECTAYFEQELYGLFFKYERDLQLNHLSSRKLFLEHMLKSGSSNSFAESDLCDTLNHAIFKQQKSPDRYESIELAQLFLNNADTHNLQCSLSRAISNTAQLNQPQFLHRLLEIEMSSQSDEVQSSFQNTVLYALEKAVEIGNMDATELLIEYLSEEVISDYSTNQLLIAAGIGGQLVILDLLLGLNLTIDYGKNKVLESALETGNPQIVKKLFDSGFKLPKQSYALESLMWSAFKYKKSYSQKSPEQLFKLLREKGLKFSIMEQRDRFILMDRVYTFAQAAWIDSASVGPKYENARRYKKAVIALTNTYIDHSITIDYQVGREQQTLLMNAVEGNLPEIVELILKHNPNLELKNKNAKTALDLATLEARIYILGSRKGFDKVYKENAQKIFSLLGGDISPFKGKIK